MNQTEPLLEHVPPGGGVEFLRHMVVVHPDQCHARIGRETLVVAGAPRSRTSMIAFILRRAGYFLGEELHHQSHENKEIAPAITTFDPDRLSSIIGKRNDAHERWGFKHPIASHRLDWFAGAVRNPVMIIAFRNPLAMCRTMVSRLPTFTETVEDVGRALRLAVQRTSAASDQAFTCGAPVILVDTDLATASPSAFVEELLGLLRIKYDRDLVSELSDKIAVPGYKQIGSIRAQTSAHSA